MASKELLRDVLQEYLAETDTGATRLTNLSGVPRKTIHHWLSGHVVQPRHWQPLIKVAMALHLTEAQADRLLQSAGHKRVRQLLAHAQGSDQAMLATFNGHVAPGSAAPFQAPMDLATFVGREDKLSELRAALLDHGQAAIVGVRGMGGVGKSALAAHAAYQLKADFPDGVLWARLDTSDTLTLLQSFATAFGHDVSQYRDVESRAAAVRHILADKRALIVLDNAETSKHVKPLLPPSTGACAVLVTTRNDLPATDGWAHIPLGAFEAQSGEAMRLFEKFISPTRAQRHTVELNQIANQLGHLPLALAIAAGQLAWSMGNAASRAEEVAAVRALLQDLKREDARLNRLHRDTDSVRASFNLSYQALPDALQRVFAQLGVFGGQDFSVEAVAYVSETSVEEAQANLDALCARSLAQPSRDQRYRLHLLLRVYAVEIGANNDEGARARMVAYYANFVEANASHERLRAEVDNILFAFDEAHRLHFRHDLVRGLAGLGSYVNKQLPREVASRHLVHAIDASHELQVPITTARLLITLSLIERESRRFDRAKSYLFRALEFLEEDRASPLWFDAYVELYGMSADLELYDEAHSYVLQAMGVAQVRQNKQQTGFCLDRLGVIALRSGDYRGAYDLFSRALAIAREMVDLNQVARLLTNLGNTAHCLEDFQSFASFSEEAVRIAREIDDKRMLAMSLHNYSDALLYNSRLELAMQCCLESLSLAKEFDLPIILIHGQVLLGRVQHRRGSLEAAESTLQGALRLAESLSHERYAETRCLFALGELYFEQGRYALALNAFTRLGEVANGRQPEMAGLSLFGLARLMYVEGKMTKAAELAGQSFSALNSDKPKLAAQVQQWAQEHISIRLD